MKFTEFVTSKKINLKEALGIEKKEIPKGVEPGIKTPIANYQQIGKHCDTCNDVTAHVRNYETGNIRCLKCKTTTKSNGNH